MKKKLCSWGVLPRDSKVSKRKDGVWSVLWWKQHALAALRRNQQGLPWVVGKTWVIGLLSEIHQIYGVVHPDYKKPVLSLIPLRVGS